MKYSTNEPAERPYQVALSAAEVIALVNYHAGHAKKIPKDLGKALLNKSNPFLTRPRDTKFLINECEAQGNAHLNRGKGLLSFLQGGAS